MKSKRIAKVLTILMVATMLTSGAEGINKLKDEMGIPSVAYAEAKASTGMQTPTGVISKVVKYTDRIPTTSTLDELKAMAIQVTPTSNPEYFGKDMVTGGTVLAIDKLYLSKNVYHYTNNENGNNMDIFIHMYAMELGSKQGTVIKHYSKAFCWNGTYTGKDSFTEEYTDLTAYNYMLNEGKEEIPPVTPEKKVYTSKRLGGLNRFETSLEIAKEYSSAPLDSVILTSAFDFPDALSGSVLAYKNNAPILLVEKTDNAATLNYVKNNLKATGKIYVLGGETVVPATVVNSLKSMGYSNIERLGGLNRYETNLNIVNKLNVPQGTDVVIANSMIFADSLSVSSIASSKGMPIFLAKGSLDSATLNKIKSIAPKNIYIIGGESAINSTIENQLKGVGAVTRIGGLNRFETSINIAKHFNLDTTTVAVANGMSFPDALTGSVLASKTNSPIILVNNKDGASGITPQKTYLDSTKISKLYILGGTSAISDSIVNSLSK